MSSTESESPSESPSDSPNAAEEVSGETLSETASGETPSEPLIENEHAEAEILAGVDRHFTGTPAEHILSESSGAFISDLPPQADAGILPVVGLGGSAGSIQALQCFFSNMPADSGLAFVVVLHLAPDFESELPSVLQRVTEMPVVAVTEQVKVEANHVYVIPPGKHLVMQNSTIHLSNLEPQYGRRVAVDLFFRSLASSHRSRAVAVVLSGMDSDGAIGIKRIKEHGGVTVAQDPDEAEHDSMPRAAIQTGMVDWVLPVEQMAGRLLDWVRNEDAIRLPPPEPPAFVAELNGKEEVEKAALDEVALREIIMFLQARTGHDFTHYKRATVLRRIGRRLQVNSLSNLHDYLVFLRTHGGEAGALLQDLLISVTNFFRDPEAFWALEAHIPLLFRDKKAGDQVRVWVAGCATGEEAYAVAMLLVEFADTLTSPPSIQVFATDIDDEATRAAREGRYPQSIAADVSPERLRRFFTLDQGYYRVRSDLREMVLFASHNLLRDSPFSRLDLVTCRNLLIYFQPEAQEKVFNLFHFALRPEGLLFLGGSEAVDEVLGMFAALDKKHRLYVRREMARTQAQMPMLSTPMPLNLPDTRSILSMAPFHEQDFTPRSRERMVPSFGELHLHLLEQYSPPSILVNADYEILHLSERAGRFLRFAGGGVSTNLMSVVHPSLRLELRSALFRVVQSGESVDVPNLSVEIEGHSRLVNISVRPFRDAERPEGPVSYLLVIIDDRASDLPASVVLQHSEDDSIARRLERELQHIKEHLRATVEQYEATTEELKASNEELQAMNEELRSAGEELETSKEELQAANEELITVNHEMKSKVEDLGRANSDLQNLMASTNIATIFLDRQLCIKRFTQPAVELFNLIPTDTGRPLFDLRHSLRYDTMRQDAEQVLEQLTPVEHEVQCEDRRWFLVRILPYRTIEDRIDGVVYTFVDITARKRVEEQLREAYLRTTEVLESIHDAFYTVDENFNFTYVNKKAEEWWGRERGSLIGKHYWTEIPQAVGTKTYEMHQKAVAEQRILHYETMSPLVQRWVDVSLYPAERGGLSCYFRDISERKQAESTLFNSQERFRLLIESVQDFSIFTITPDNVIDSWNPGAEKIFGYSKVEIVGQSASILFLPEDRERGVPEQELETARKEGRADDERWHLRKDGSHFYASGVTTLLSNDPWQGFVKVARDLTEQKQAEEVRSRLASIIEVSSDAIITFDFEGHLLSWNRGAEQMLGYSAEEIIGQSCLILVPQEFKAGMVQLLEALQRGETVADYDTQLLSKDKKLIDVSISSAPLHDENGHLIGGSATIRDITAQKTTEEILRQSRDELEGHVRERTAQLRRSNRELLRVEAARAQLMRQLVSAEEEERRRIARELHDQMGQQIAALMIGIKGIRDASHGRSKTLDTIDKMQGIVENLDQEVDRLALELRPAALDDLGLQSALRQYMEDWSLQTGIKVDLHCQGFKKRLPLEIETTIYRVTQEAMTNIAKHSGAEKMSLILEKRGDWVRAVLEDNGKGFVLKNSGQHASSNRRQLGLSGMQERVALWGGTFSVETKPGKGTSIFVRIPLKLPKLSTTDEDPPENEQGT